MSKKTETIEVRVSPELKSELSEMSKSRRQAMSQTIRDLIRKELSSAALNSSNAKVGNMTKSGTQRLREAGLAGITLVSLAVVWNLTQQTPVSAQATVRATFAEMDRNEDDVVTKEEFDAFMSEGFVEFSTEIEDSGLVEDEIPEACKAEFAALKEESAGEGEMAIGTEFAQFDTNEDGKIVFGEVQRLINQEMTAEFASADANKDGFLSRAEFADETSGLHITELSNISASCAAALPLPNFAELEARPMELRVVFAAMDENRDGRISKTEFLNN